MRVREWFQKHCQFPLFCCLIVCSFLFSQLSAISKSRFLIDCYLRSSLHPDCLPLASVSWTLNLNLVNCISSQPATSGERINVLYFRFWTLEPWNLKLNQFILFTHVKKCIQCFFSETEQDNNLCKQSICLYSQHLLIYSQMGNNKFKWEATALTLLWTNTNKVLNPVYIQVCYYWWYILYISFHTYIFFNSVLRPKPDKTKDHLSCV